ncbi:MAG: hypothetical protein JSS60_00630 [Verrucomicrobia bacterium]|nr:hypothetical protein [Verrucomicrobiota bacterium]
MWLSEEMTESHPLFNKVQYITTQSCERSEAEINYVNINRKYIAFDLRDKALMVLVGLTLKPFGFLQNLEDYFFDSKFRIFRVWAETSIAKRGESHLRNLYLKHPQKFFEVEFENAKSVKMKMIKCNYSISEMCSSKRVALNDSEQSPDMMSDFRKKIQKQEQKLFLSEQLIEEFSPRKESNTKLLGVQEEK